MPYKKLSDLPDTVNNSLPKPAREIYLAAYNSAWDQYKDAEDRQGGASREEVSHKVAWAAVEKKFTKDENDNWISKDEKNGG